MWEPIQNLPPNWELLAKEELVPLAKLWQEQSQQLKNQKAALEFQMRLRRKIAIETGVLEQLYNIDRGITHLLIERGIDEALIPHGSTDRPSVQVVAIIRDHEAALERVFDFVGEQRPLSNSYIKSLHQLLTRHQDTSDAVDQFGRIFQAELLKGDWKKHPNNPTRPDGSIHTYCPPDQVAPQMDQLITWHLAHEQLGVTPDVEAAWLHHRFTQIHPFQDGNGRVARMLASLVFIKGGWFPLVITRDDRASYIDALEIADSGDIEPLVELFALMQRREFLNALSISYEVLSERHSYQSLLSAIEDKLKNGLAQKTAKGREQVEALADQLFDTVREKFKIVERDIRTLLLHVKADSSDVFVTYADSHNPKSHYYRAEIIATAKKLDYYANLWDYKAWVRLSIKIDDVQTDMLISFHNFGATFQNLMVCSGAAFRRVVTDEDKDALTESLEPLSISPFQFSYLDDLPKLQKRFADWLDNAILVGLEYWRKSL